MKSMLVLSELQLVESKEELAAIPNGKVLINTINAHSYNVAQKDKEFAEALKTMHHSTPRSMDSDTCQNECVKYLIPDGNSIVQACRWLEGKSKPKERIAGWDLFVFEMKRVSEESLPFTVYGLQEDEKEESLPFTVYGLNENGNGKKKVMFMGSSEKVLGLIRERAAVDYPNLQVVTLSPPYKEAFSEEDNKAIVKAINKTKPDLLWIGMTAPKQEKWTYQHWQELDINCHVGTIGAVFDFYAGTVKRAPLWWQEHGVEWLYRLLKEPKRMWRRYVIGNPLFIWYMMKEHYGKKK